jgi:hypothetical protein
MCGGAAFLAETRLSVLMLYVAFFLSAAALAFFAFLALRRASS